MLSFQTVYPDTLELLNKLSQTPILQDMRLVGGTSLALQYGHRRSVDLDFFGKTTDDVDELTGAIHDSVGKLAILSVSKKIRVYSINNVKVDIVNYDYPWIDNADSQPMPFMFENVSWQQIKATICTAVEQYNQNHG